jgi:prevent-host-death family protein
MKIASVGEIKARFSSFLKASQADPIVVTRNGKPVAVIMGVGDEDEVERLLMSRSSHLRSVLEKSRRQIRQGDVLHHDDFWQKIRTSRAPRNPGRRRRQA